MSKHTPGVWFVQPVENGFFEVITDQYDVTSSTLLPRDMGSIRKKADALLISAAPELLEALEECERVLSDLSSTSVEGTKTRSAWTNARAAIKKAMGEE